MSTLKVRLAFSSEEREHVMRVASGMGLTAEQFCRQAVAYTIQEAYRLSRIEQQRQEEQQRQAQGVNENGEANTEGASGISAGDSQPTPEGGDSNSDALASSNDAAHPSE